VWLTKYFTESLDLKLDEKVQYDDLVIDLMLLYLLDFFCIHV